MPFSKPPHRAVVIPVTRRWLRARPAIAATVSLLTCLLLTTVLTDSTPAAEPPQEVTRQQVTESIERSVAYLISRQHESGCFSDDRDPYKGKREAWQRDLRENRYRHPRHSTALTSLAILSLASLGHQPCDPTDEGRAMARAIDYVVSDAVVDRRGYFGSQDHSRMYGHGITTLMLAEMTGMGRDANQDRKVRERCQQAIDLILKSQSQKKSWQNAGGWRYLPDSGDSDLSVTVWQLMALRSAKNSGIRVPSTAIDQAIKYLQVCYDSDRHVDGTPKKNQAGFSYQRGRAPEFASTSAGVLALQVCGAYDYPEIDGACDFLLSEKPPDPNRAWIFYGLYYYAQGLAQRGGEQADIARKVTEDLLFRLQRDDGSYEGRGQENSRIYCTAMAILSLSVQHHFLPIYQR